MRRRSSAVALAVLVTLVAACAAGCRPPSVAFESLRSPAIAYSGYRAEQSPKTGVRPTREQVAEDLRILAKHWRLIRIYAADAHGEDVLATIRSEGLDLDVMLGIWLAREPGAEQENERQIADGIRLANEYDDIVVAVNVGNEVLIEWTEHPVPEARVLHYVRQVRPAVPQPVTVADNYVWWRDHGDALAREVDFITIHSYPLWERLDIDEGLSYTIENFEQVRAAHPNLPIVIGEAGWATYTEGNLHVPRGGDETKQRRYFDELTGWAAEHDVTVFWFEAFDEPWKGTGTEGYWGLFTVDREAKPAVQARYPELMPDGPTSPVYPETIATAGPALSVVARAGLAAANPGGSVNPLGPGLAASRVVSLPEADGGEALHLSFNGESWAGVYLMLDGYDASAHDALVLRLGLPERVAAFELKLEGAAADAASVDLLDHAVGTDGDGWTTFRVPLSALRGVDLSRLTRIGLWNPSDRSGGFVVGGLLVDGIGFEPN